jgi:hypothetical protein
MKNKIWLYFTLVLLLMSSTCSKENDSELFKIPYTGSELKLDGYYYSEEEVSFLYSDGVSLYGSSRFTYSLFELEEIFRSSEFQDLIKGTKTRWGVFTIEGNEIEWERWGDNSGGALRTYVRSGRILNDSMFLVSSILNNYSGESFVRNDTFRFKLFSPKPDSTNTFVQ